MPRLFSAVARGAQWIVVMLATVVLAGNLAVGSQRPSPVDGPSMPSAIYNNDDLWFELQDIQRRLTSIESDISSLEGHFGFGGVLDDIYDELTGAPLGNGLQDIADDVRRICYAVDAFC